MNIAVINIRDLIKYVAILCILVTILVIGVKIVIGKGELEKVETEATSKIEDSSFLYCLEMEIPLMASEKNESTKAKNTLGSTYGILDTELAVLSSMKTEEDIEEQEQQEKINEETENSEDAEERQIEERDRTINSDGGVETKVISENNIEASFTNSESDIKVKNQSKYDINDLIKDTNYEVKNKNKVIIYHTHTCESYTSSEKYNYEMTGAYRTTDLNYTVSKVRRRIRSVFKAVW